MLFPLIIITMQICSLTINTYVCLRVCLKCRQSSRLPSSLSVQYVWLCMLDWPFKFRWSRGYMFNSSYYHYQIGSINFDHCCLIFSWLCAWGGCAIICYRFHIYPEKAGVVFLYHCVVLRFAQIIEYIMARWSYSLVCTLHYLIIIIMQVFLKALNF